MSTSDDLHDPHDLRRFVDAQRDAYPRALAELRAGSKRSHWMWFVFPQVAGLGASEMSRRYAIRDQDEASAYLAHPLLGPRLLECAEAALGVPGVTAREIFHAPDDLKLRSSATLFGAVSPAGSVFHRVLDRFFKGTPDQRTLEILRTAWRS